MAKVTKMICQNILITTKDFIEPAGHYRQQFYMTSDSEHVTFYRTIEVKEGIDEMGIVTESLVENEINNVLRLVFQSDPDSIFISLRNSCKNPLHERILLNLLLTAGYRSVYVSHRM
jgi:N-methylhydantoinase A/oxoprolinase/acetone carboxylase beta subunit